MRQQSNAPTNTKVVSLTTQRPFQLGAREVKANNTTYQATTDGFVTAWGGSSMTVYSDTSITPTTIVCQTGVSSGVPAILVPILKNYYWKVTGATDVLWNPLT